MIAKPEPLSLADAYFLYHGLKTVLIVEDDADILSSLAELIRDQGYAVETAANGYQALEMIGEHKPELILLDLMMPVMNGWAFVDELRRRLPEVKIPIVLISARRDLAKEAARMHVDYWLQKPFRLDAIKRITEEVCGPGRPSESMIIAPPSG